MFQYVYGRVAEKKYNQKLAFDLTWYNISSSHRYRELEGHESYRLSAFSIEPELINDTQSQFFNSKPGKLVNLIHFNLIDRGIKPLGPAYFQGYWLGESFFEHMKDDVVDMFKITDIENQDALKYKRKIEGSSAPVSMHIRRGDYKNHKHLQVCTPEYYKSAIKHLDKTLGNYELFVFSDDIAYCQDMLKGIPNVTFIENGGSDVDEFKLMIHCKHHVISNSTFSWWSAWLGENRSNDNRMVLTPNRWFNQTEGESQAAKSQDVNKIIPERWTKVEF
ncbi:MAG: alpha-1,2-fucosyltransferase [Anaerolineae bacterium]